MNFEQLIAEARAAARIDENADLVAAIAALTERAENAERAVRESATAVDRAEMLRMQGELADAQRRLLMSDSEAQRELVAMRNSLRETQADAEVERLVAAGRIRPVSRDVARSLYLTTPPERWQDTVALFPSIDLAERGIAAGSDLEGLEPSAQDIAVAKSLGQWNDADPTASKLAIMQQKARDAGLSIPSGYTPRD